MIEQHQPETERSGGPSAKWVWCSHPGTTETGTFSVLAAAEVFIAVGAYWGFAIWAHTQTHLLLGIAIAPLLLLRSKDSIKLGIKWFERFDFCPYSKTESSSWTSSLVDRSLESIPETGWFNTGFRFGNFVFLLLIACIFGLTAAFVVRICATIRYLMPGIKSLSDNWWRTLFATDVFTRPEIIPGHTNTESLFHFDEVTRETRGLTDRYLFESKNERRAKSSIILTFGFELFQMTLVYLITFAPCYIYRMSIKSTAWAHWPLAYIARPRKISDDPEEVRLRLWWDPREWLLRVVMLMTFVGTAFASLPSVASFRELFPNGVVSPVEYAFLIDVKTLFVQPWRVVALISAVITFFLTWYGWELSLLIARSSAQTDRASQAMTWAATFEYAMRIRTVCGWIFWALILSHAALWLAPSTHWVTGYPREILQVIYGEFLPPDLRR